MKAVRSSEFGVRRKSAIILISHGSRCLGFDTPLRKVQRILQREIKNNKVLLAYLEINSPSISEAVDRCVRDGFKEIRLLPYFVLLGNHVKKDIPAIVSDCKKKYRGKARITLCPYLGFDKKIVDVVKERLRCR